MSEKLFSHTRGTEASGRSHDGRPSRRMVLSCGFTLVLTCVLLYLPALNNSFINWDDSAYVIENSHIHSLSLKSFYWMITAFHATNWHPLTWLSHGVDCAFFGLNPSGHHLTSIILHGLNTLLVFLLAVQLVLKATTMNMASPPSTVSRSLPVQVLIAGGVTALLFGVHPLRAESVAWVAERKDVLCAFFFLLTLCSYLFYASPVEGKNRRAWFTVCVLLAGTALLAKPMAVTIPLVLLLLDIYPLKRIILFRSTPVQLPVFLEKVPFFALSAFSAVITILAQHAGGALETLERLPLYFRLLNAFHSPLFYLTKMLWPATLVPFYPFPHLIPLPEFTYYVISVLLMACITGGCLWMLKRGRHLFFTVWAYYLITLCPVVGIIQVGSQAAADRYTYLPSIGIFLLAGVGVSRTLAASITSYSRMLYAGLIAALIFGTLGKKTVSQIRIWQESETLWRYVIKNFPGRVPIAHNNLGVLYDSRGLSDKAFEEYEKALAINPTFADARSNLGLAYDRRGNVDRAIKEYKKALADNPALVEARNNLGLAYYGQGRYDQAVEEYEKVLAINPSLAETRYNLGLAYYAQGRHDQAVEEYEKVLTINPSFPAAHYKLAVAFCSSKNYAQAKMHFDRARELGYKVDPTLEALIKQAP